MNIHCKFFHRSRFLSNLRLPWKNRVALKFFTVLNIFFTIQEFWTTLRLPEKQSCPEIFHCIEYTFYIQDFWATCACPEKQSCPEIFHCVEYIFFIIQDFWATCACPENRVCPENFHFIEIFLIVPDFWATSACHENRVRTENFQARGGAAALPDPPPRALMVMTPNRSASLVCFLGLIIAKAVAS